ncbi:MAG: hypothetical protein P8Y02_07775 [Deinococcales bacterium]
MAPPDALGPREALEPLEAAPLDVPADPPVDACVDDEPPLDADEPLAVELVEGDEEDVEGDVADGAELCVVALCAGGVLVRVFCPTGKNDPPVMSVAMMPAITATRAIPISRSGQLRLSQSMVPF